MTAAFENIAKADNVTADIGLGIGQTIAYARLCGEITDGIKLLLGKQGVEIFSIFKVELYKLLVGVLATAHTVVIGDVTLRNACTLKSAVFYPLVVVVIDIVEPDHLIAARQ